MKKLLATTAVALVAMAGAASAQSVLERVLSEIDNAENLASVNGTFANIAENIGGGDGVVYENDGAVLTEEEFSALVEDSFGTFNIEISDSVGYFVDMDDDNRYDSGDVVLGSAADATLYARQELFADGWEGNVVAGGIDGSITNVVNGVSDAVAEATQMAAVDTSVVAYEWNLPTTNFGDMSTTVLGAVNTGDITLGVNQAVDEAKTTSTGALSSVIEQIGGSEDTGALVLNIASNMTGVNGSISTTMADVNGTVGAAATTVLGAVNTGTIVSGVNAAVSGIVSTGTEQLAN